MASAVDPVTWEAISPDGDPEKVAYLNTPELKQARQEAAFDIAHPIPANDTTGKTSEQITAEEKAAAAILNPIDVTTLLLSKVPEEQKAIQNAIDAILHPTPAH